MLGLGVLRWVCCGCGFSVECLLVWSLCVLLGFNDFVLLVLLGVIDAVCLI